MNNWQDKPETKKGNVAEDIVIKKLIECGYSVFKNLTDAPHLFDLIKIDKDYNISIVEVKCKELRLKYPDTGFPKRNFDTYIEVNKKNKVTIVWIDYKKGEIYGNELDELNKRRVINVNGNPKKYPSTEIHDIIYFPYECMKVYAKLNPEEIIAVKEASDSLKKELNNNSILVKESNDYELLAI